MKSALHTFICGTAFKESIPIGIGQITGFIGTLIALRLATSVMTLETFGLVSLGLTLIGLQSLLSSSPLGASAGRLYAMALEKGELRLLYRALTKIFLISALVSLCVCGIFQFLDVLKLEIHELLSVSLLLGLVACFSGASNVLDSLLIAARLRWRVALVRTIDPWTKLGSAAIVCFLWGSFISYALIGMLAGAALGIVIRLCLTPKAEHTGSNGSVIPQQWETRILEYGLPYLSWGWAHWIWSASDRWGLEYFQSSEFVAHYAVLYQLGYASLLALFGPINQLAQPHVYARAGDATDPSRVSSGRRIILKVMGASASLGIFVVLVFTLFGSLIMEWCAAPQYGHYANLLPIFGAAAVVFGVAQNLELFHLVELNPRTIVLPKMAFFFVAAALNLVVAAHGDIADMAWLQLFHSIMYGVILTTISRKQLRSITYQQR